MKKKMEKKVKRIIPMLAAFLLIFGMAMPVYGIKAPKVVITDIYHRHIGNPDVYGGCYRLAIEHIHQGSASTGTGCYTKPVYHTHQGDENIGGGCYGKEIYHEHQGNATDGGGCYSEPVNHEHQDGCYEERECTVSFTTVKVLGTETGRCFSGHGDTTFVRVESIGTHERCDIGTENAITKYCQTCGFMAPVIHDYQALTCGKDENTVEGYKTGCGKEETEVERYEVNCGHGEDEIESYEIECGKDVDGYGLDCGLEEDVPCGRLIVTNETEDTAQQVTLSVKLVDLTGGKLELDSNPYVWQDENGNQAGSGDRIQVKENGNYSVRVKLKNKDVDESGLSSKILVDNISKVDVNPTKSPGPTPSKSPAAFEEPASSPDPIDTPDTEPDSGPSGNEEPAPEENKENVLPDKEERSKERRENTDTPTAAGQTQETVKKAAKKNIGKKAGSIPNPSTMPSPKIVKETKKEVLPERQTMGETQYKVGQAERKKSIFANSMVRMISLTAGALALIGGILLWLLYLRNSIKVYNDNGEGRMIYLGRCIVRLLEDAYTISITEAMVEKAYTNRYCIKPGLFRFGRKDEALVVYKELKNATIYINKEMIVIL